MKQAQKFDPGIRQEILPGLVTEYECRSVAKAYNYTWTEWLLADYDERISCVAHHRVSGAIEAQVHESYTRYAERQQRRQRRRG